MLYRVKIFFYFRLPGGDIYGKFYLEVYRLMTENQNKVIELIKQTGPLIFQEMTHEKVTEKGAADYVTNVDVAVQNFLKDALAKEFPDIALIAEEKENLGLDPAKSYWILDPIDGTTNLIRDYHLSAVSLGLYENGEITFGVVYNPFTEELFCGAKKEGAFLNGVPIHVSDQPEFKDAVISFGSSPYEKNRAKDLFPVFYNVFMNCADFRRTGSAALDLCYVACGRQHAFLEQNLKPWDYSGAAVILTEAGGTISDWKNEKLPYLVNADILACVPQFREILLKLIEQKY